MERSVLISIAVVIIAAAAAAAAVYSFFPVYYITGRVNDATDGSGVKADGHTIYFYRSTEEAYSKAIYSSDIIGPSGIARTPNIYDINAYQCFDLHPRIGETMKVASARDIRGYGAGPASVLFTGTGWELLPDMTLVLGGGVDPFPTPGENLPPRFKEIWFGNRMYRASLVEKGEEFIVSPSPKIKTIIEANGDSGIKQSSVTIVVNENTSAAKALSIASSAFSINAMAGIISSMSVDYQMLEADKLAEGHHTFTFSAAEMTGTSTAREICTVTVMGGDARVIGEVVISPHPFSPKKHGTVFIQYTLSVDSDIEIYLYSISGEITKRLFCAKGTEGGSAGINKVAWDGRTTFGEYAGNGIYAGTIHDPAQNKTLAKFKLAIFH